METNWLWDKDITEEQAKAILADTKDSRFIVYAALLLSRTNSAKDVFRDFLSRENFFLSWSRIKRQMRKDSWNDPRVDYWQAIYDTLKEEMPELKELKVAQFQDPSVSPVPGEIGKKIKALREQTGWTQNRLAKELGISQQIISRIESGRQNVSLETLDSICTALGISVAAVFNTQPEISEKTITFPFSSKSPDEFVKIVFEIIERSKEEYSDAQFYDGPRDKGRDILAYKYKVGKKEQWYFQCKRYVEISFSTFKGELEKIVKHSQKDKNFRPDGVVFVTACKVSAPCKDNTKAYAREVGLGEVIFWTDVELTTKAKVVGIYDELSPITKKDFKESWEDIKKHVSLERKKSESKKGEVNKVIDEAVKEIHQNNIEKAKQILLNIKGKIEDNPEQYKEELIRTYNNLGVCYDRFEADGGNFDEAEKYFLLAIERDPGFTKGKINLASVYLSKGGEQSSQKAYDISSASWEDSDKKDPKIFQTFIWAKFHYQSPKEAIAYYEKSKESQALVQQNEQLLNLMGTMYLGQGDYRKAGELIDKALVLAPDSPPNLMLKARAFMLRAQTEKMERSFFEVIPKFENYEDIEKAKEFLKKALEIISGEKNPFLENQIKYDLCMCLLWLRDPDFIKAIEEIDKERLGSIERKQIDINKILWYVSQRNFETAYNELVKSPDWPVLFYGEKARMAHIFLLCGAPEQSKEIFKTIEAEGDQKRDVHFWIDMSLNEILLGNKNSAIHATQKAKEFSQGTSKEKMVLSHVGAVNLRYARDNEVDRLMTGLSEHDSKYPEDKILRPIKIMDENGQISEDFKSILQKQSDWFEGIKKSFQADLIPSYWLEKILRRPYAEILSFRGPDEVDFTIELHVPNESFQNELLNNLNKAEHLVFDYASLLNISKMNLLGHLEKFGKKISISRELFNRVQSELLTFEHDDIRNLWRFLRSSREIDIVENIYSVRKDEKYSSLFDEWLTDSIRIVKEKNATFIIDDLRLIKLFRFEEKLSVCNSFTILKSMLSRGWIDAKMYSTSLGDLAERFYVFLPFSGDDLFQIVMEDKSKVTLRSYHLVNQMFLPGSNVESFTQVFVRFIDLLWQTGSLSEDKVTWLQFFTKNVLKLLERQGGIQDDKELQKVVPNFVQMWIIAVQQSRKDEILLLEKRVDEIFKASAYSIFKDNVSGFIKVKKTSLGLA